MEVIKSMSQKGQVKRMGATRDRRRHRIRRHLQGTADRPRLSVSKSLRQITAQIVDDVEARTIVFCSSLSKDVDVSQCKNKVDVGRVVGMKLGEMALAAGISQVCFDRGYSPYHGRVKAVAEGARKAGLKF